jgi:cysteine sulfinate desulfinase/cysteine desulfurase-like protein
VKSLEGAEVLNDVDYTQVCISFGSDARTREVTQKIIADGATWMSGSHWKDQDVLRISVSNWSTNDEDVRLSLEALSRAAAT